MTPNADILSNIGPTALMVLAPFVIITATSFAKTTVVLGIVRSALGAQGVPPNSVLMALAVVMSIFIMAPVASDIADSVEASATLSTKQSDDALGIKRARALYNAASPPLLDFLKLNTPRKEVDFFEQLAGEPHSEKHSLRIMLPAFASSELVEALLMGFLIFLPFWVIDLLVGNVLLALGMHMMSPSAVSLPLKLFLFVAADGWHLIVNGLAISYGM